MTKLTVVPGPPPSYRTFVETRKPFRDLCRDDFFSFFLLILGLGCFALILWPFSIDLTLAGIFALGLYPVVRKINEGFDRNLPRFAFFLKGWSPLLILGLVLIVSTGLLVLAVLQAYQELSQLSQGQVNPVLAQVAEDFRQLWASFQEWLTSELAPFGVNGVERLKAQFLSMAEDAGRTLVGAIGRLISRFPQFVLHFLVFTAILFLMIAKGENIRRFFERMPWASPDFDELLGILQETSLTVLSANLLIGAIQASIVTVGAIVADYSNWALIFIITFIGSFVPVIGAGPIAFLLALFSYLSKDNGGALLLVVVSIIAGTIDNFLRPLLVARTQKNLHPLVGLIGVLGSVLIFGFPGIFIGAFAMALTVNLYPRLNRKLKE